MIREVAVNVDSCLLLLFVLRFEDRVLLLPPIQLHDGEYSLILSDRQPRANLV